MLADRAKKRGHEVALLDLNLPRYRYWGDSSTSFYDAVDEVVERIGPDAIGVTSMGVNSHVAVGIAKRSVERLGIEAIVGGHHLGRIAPVVELLAPGVRVATRERRMVCREHWWGLEDGPSRGARGVGEVFSEADLDEYFLANPRRVANWEMGRGCKHRCAFCYSPMAYPGWETVPCELVAESFDALAAMGFAHVFIVDDNLTNDSAWLRELCEELRKGRPLTWNGYATVLGLHGDLLAALGEAGCVNLYVGVDAVGPMLQKQWHKRFFRKVEEVYHLVIAGRRAGVTLTCAFILSPDDRHEEENELAVECAVEVVRLGGAARFSMLCPYPGTGMGEGGDLEYSEDRAGILMDVPAVVVENAYAREFPAAFPWHGRPRASRDWTARLLSLRAIQAVLLKGGVSTVGAREVWRKAQEVGAMMAEGDERLQKTDLGRILRERVKGVEDAVESW